MRNIFSLFACFLFAAGLGTPLSAANADDLDMVALQTKITEIIDRVRPAVVNIGTRGGGFSGVIVSPEGHVLSAAHAVTPGQTYRISLPDGRRYRGVGKGSNSRTDCALILITEPDDDLPCVPMGDSGALVFNQPCLSISYPGGQKAGREPVVRFGRIIRNSRTRGMIQSTALMEPGDSGGPLFDLNGYVIGIHSRIGQQMDRNYEVPVNVYRNFWNELNREATFTRSGPPTPRLGVRCSPADEADNSKLDNRKDTEDEGDSAAVSGMQILSVQPESLAAQSDLRVDDVLLTLYERELESINDLRSALVAARDDGVEVVTAIVRRGADMIELEIQYNVEREAAPDVPLPETDFPSVPDPVAYSEMAALGRHLSELESELDDACVTITSVIGEDDDQSAVGTRIRNTQWILSKSSVVGDNPQMETADNPVPLTVVARDAADDLVLLRAPDVQKTGIEFAGDQSPLSPGTFLITPEAEGTGDVSVVGSPPFASAKERSRGYLGVIPATYQGNAGVVLNEVTEDGAARRAGLKVGDIVIKLNDTVLRTQRDMRAFLTEADPNAVITATLRRNGEELTKSITLGAVPTMSGHAADMMLKSKRRDGFTQVFTHDADLLPNECGGPIFTLEGDFIGLNIARNSRVRSYALPAAVIREFVDESSAKN